MSNKIKISFLDIFSSHGSFLLKLMKLIDYSLGAVIAYILPARKQVNVPKIIQKILIIRPGGIGDAVFLLPILKVLKEKGIIVDILCEPRNAEVFSSQGYSVFFYNHISSLNKALKNSYDVVIDTEQWHYLSAVVAYFSKTECRIGFDTRALRAKLFDQAIPYADNDYELDNFTRLLEVLLPIRDIVGNINHSFIVPDRERLWALEQIPQDNSIAVFLGGSIALRRLSENQLLEAIKAVLSKEKNVILLGGLDVVDVADQIMRKVNDPRVVSFVGRVSLVQSAALIQRCETFIGPDSGLLHIASALGIPVVAVFGPGNLSKWKPRGNKDQVLTINASCSPCTRFGYTVPTCKGSYHCVKEIKLDNLIV